MIKLLSRQQKQEIAKQLEQQFLDYPVVAVASIAGLKSSQYNAIKKKVRDKVVMIVARKTLLTRAMDAARPELKQIQAQMTDAEIIILTKLDPFKLFKTFKQNKSKTFAKPGQLAPADIIVPAGETNLAPGPVLTELKQAKIDAKIQGPKIVIGKDSTVVKKDEPISEPVTKALSKLGIQPFEVGVEVKAVYSDGLIYTADVLDVDQEYYLTTIRTAYSEATAIAIATQYFAPEFISPAIVKAELEALTIAERVKKDEKVAETPAEAQQPPA
ncbi:TPA: 50S ribosomal protein L10 [Candidatus Micrarchaeota archaeon]|nr:MAG: 50S ribosomal protein L10 [Candidatus Micrarchaeota archaeon CG1_02_51_15]HII38766.1 50S ribosomal protein L10 [Candidatus Micrarchaeota archaeon]